MVRIGALSPSLLERNKRKTENGKLTDPTALTGTSPKLGEDYKRTN